jgi:quinol monooxygenase YgiN
MILIIGHLKIAPEKFAAVRAHAHAMIKATRKESGCLLYAFAEDIAEPGVLRITERWESWEALKLHGATPHMAAWRAALKDIGVLAREVTAWEAGEMRTL